MKFVTVVLALVVTLTCPVNADTEDELMRYLTRILYRGVEVSLPLLLSFDTRNGRETEGF